MDSLDKAINDVVFVKAHEINGNVFKLGRLASISRARMLHRAVAGGWFLGELRRIASVLGLTLREFLELVEKVEEHS